MTIDDRADDHLRIYLDDHWAGAGAGVALTRRLAAHNEGSPFGDGTAAVAAHVREDEANLRAVRVALGVDSTAPFGSAKRVVAMAGERIAALKPNGRLTGYSPLSRVIELEAATSAVTAKTRLWSALASAQAEHDLLPEFDFAALEARSAEHVELLVSMHREATPLAFSASTHP